MAFVDDGTFDWSMGQDAWHSPDRIQANQYASGINVSTRGGVLSPRPGYVHRQLRFDSKTVKTQFGERSIEAIWTSGKFQALIPYLQGDPYLITVVSGLVYITNARNFKTMLLTDLRLNQYASRINWSYAADKLVIFDYPDYPLIVDMLEVKRADINHELAGFAAPQVPISRMGTYNQSRLFVVNGRSDFTAGDPVGVVEGPITFTEIFEPSSPYVNQQFGLPDGDTQYPVTAMGFIQMIDTSTGVGPLFIATEKKVYTFNTDQPRAEWTKSRFGTVILDNVGMAGPRAFVNVNSDLLFMSGEGQIHALSTARNNAKQWGNVPISREVHNFIKTRDGMQQLTVMGYFDNRVLIAVNPFRTQALDRNKRAVSDYAFGGFVALEIESMASLLAQGTPTWSGLWTGIRPMEIQNIKDMCFVVAKEGGNRLYEIAARANTDVVSNRKRLIRSRVYTKRYDFQKPADLKQEHTVLVHLQDLKGRISLQIDRKTSHGNDWLKLGEWNHHALKEVCQIPSDAFINGFSPHQPRQLIFGDGVEQGCNPVTQEAYARYRSIQYRITIQGENWKLELFKARATALDSGEYPEEGMCEELPPQAVPRQCTDDWMIPEEQLCRL